MIAAKTRRETKDLEVEDIIEEKSLKEIRNYNVILGSEKDIISLRINLDFFGILNKYNPIFCPAPQEKINNLNEKKRSEVLKR